jgi:hypothetical protein
MPLTDNILGHSLRATINVHLLAILFYALGAAFSLLLLQEEIAGYAWLVILHLVGAAAFYWLWSQQGSREVRFESFGAVVLLSCAVFRSISAVDTWLNGMRLEQWHDFIYGYTQYPEWTIFWAEIMSVIGFLLVSLGWQCGVLGRRINLGLFARTGAATQTVLFMYLSSLAAEIARKRYGQDFTGYGQLILVLHLGGIAAIFGIVSKVSRVASRIGLAAVLGLPLAYLAAGGGMKENIILPMLPCAYFAWDATRGRISKVLLLSAGFAVLCILQVYVEIIRNRVWIGGEQLSTNQTIEALVDSADLDTFLNGLNKTFGRVNLTNMHAWTTTIASNVGFLPEDILAGLESIYIPRFLWPDKPDYTPGLQHTFRVYGYKKDLYSSTASGFVAELYLAGGLLTALLGSLAFGFGIALLQRLVSRMSTPLAVQVHNFSLFILAIRLDEDHVVYAFSGPISFVVFLILYSKLWSFVEQIGVASRAKRQQTQYWTVR